MFDIGDCVVCIDGRQGINKNWWYPKKGSFYRIADMGKNRDGEVWVDLAEDPNPDRDCGWHATRFRKLPPAEPEFISLIRSLGVSKRVREDA